MPYKIGDIVRLFYPYVPKVKQAEIIKQVARYEDGERPVFFEGKNRYGVVVGVPNHHSSELTVVQIMTHGEVTETDDYRFRDDELKVPRNIYVAHSGTERELTGVVKMERMESFSKDEVSSPLNKLPPQCKGEMIERYQFIMDNLYYQDKLNTDSPKHRSVMRDFIEYTIASKLEFLTDDYGENHYQSMKRELFCCNRIKKIGKHKDSNIYAVELKGESGSFLYNISTKKDEKKISEDWFGRKPAVYWLKQDSKYHVLENNISTIIQLDPIRHPSELKSFRAFQRDVVKKDRRSKRNITVLER